MFMFYSEALRGVAEKCEEGEFQFEDEDIFSRGEISKRGSELKCRSYQCKRRTQGD